MVITVTCPSCTSAFPVDPAKIPEGGVNARCTQCNDVFRVEKPAEPAPEPVMELPEIAPEPVVEAPAPPEPDPVAFEAPATMEAPEPPAPDPLPELASPPAGEADPFAETAPFESPAAPEPPPLPDPVPATPAPDPTPAPAEAAPVQGFTFGKRDPTDKAKRLARVLVSDMIMYNAERHQSALAEGTLVADFEEEIEKSWKEYVEQVGDEMANGPGKQFWTEALNDILAKGEQVF